MRQALTCERSGSCHKPRSAFVFAILIASTHTAFCQDNAAQPAFKKLDSMEARVQGCVTCHGQQGQGTNNGYFPRIAGKPAGYIYNQLLAFRNGTRSYPPMNYLVAYLPDTYLKEIAEYYSKLNRHTPFARSLARPKAIYAGGNCWL